MKRLGTPTPNSENLRLVGGTEVLCPALDRNFCASHACPEHGTDAALVLTACNCKAMQLHLDEIVTKVAPERTPYPP